MNSEEIKKAIDLVAYGITILSGSIGIKYLINAIKYFILHVMPLIKKQSSEKQENKCTYHDTIDRFVQESSDTTKTVIKLEERSQEHQRRFESQEEINKEIFLRLKEIEGSAVVYRRGVNKK